MTPLDIERMVAVALRMLLPLSLAAVRRPGSAWHMRRGGAIEPWLLAGAAPFTDGRVRAVTSAVLAAIDEIAHATHGSWRLIDLIERAYQVAWAVDCLGAGVAPIGEARAVRRVMR